MVSPYTVFTVYNPRPIKKKGILKALHLKFLLIYTAETLVSKISRIYTKTIESEKSISFFSFLIYYTDTCI